MCLARPNWLIALLMTVGVVLAPGETPAADGDAMAVPAPTDFSIAQLDFFEQRIRPLLVSRCIACHGPELQESGLRLDRRSDVLRGGDRGQAVVPGSSDQSLLLRAVSYDNDQLVMPPDGKLSPREIDDLRQWIDHHAAWPDEESVEQSRHTSLDASDHWAFQAIRKPALPQVRDTGWPRNAVDYFVLSKLEASGLAPSPPAPLHTLVRRMAYDLTGMPPSLETVQRIGAGADRPRVLEDYIEELLARPQYGERWGRHWLDVARYADTKGYVDGGQVRFAFAYTYRNYVIRALNCDLPFDEFIHDQLAADQRQYAADQQWRLAGMGFLTVGRRFNHNFYDTIDDQIDVISRGLHGVTVSCARCHDHKYDPVPTADYYSLYGILASSFEPHHSDLPLLNEWPATQDATDFQAELRRRATAYDDAYLALHRKIQHELRAYAGDYLVYVVQESPRHRQGEQNPLRTPRVVLRGPTAYGYGAIRRWRAYLKSREADDPVFGVWQRMEKVDPSEFATQLNQQCAQDAVNALLRKALRAAQPTSMVEFAQVYGRLLEDVYTDWTRYVEAVPDVTSFDDAPREQLRQVLFGPEAAASMTPFESIDCYHLDEHTEMRNLAGKVEEHSIKTSDAASRAMILRQRELPLQPAVFLRGQPDRLGTTVPRQIPTIFACQGTPAQQVTQRPPGNDRLALARATVSRDNPLTARVIVNRVWYWHFGVPLVATVSDFGLRSNPPSHPELLDYLATGLMENHWSLKRLHALIMSSRTYQQSSRPRSDGYEVDPQNRLLWRYNARRLEWEAIRDSLLAASGRLNLQVARRPVEQAADDPESVCRTIYLFVDRQNMSSFARNFDFPSADFTSPQRSLTVVPQQQLFFLNSPFVRKQAEALAQQALQLEPADDRARFRWLYRQVLASDSTWNDEETDRWLDELRSVSSSRLDFWISMAHAILQSNEFIFLE